MIIKVIQKEVIMKITIAKEAREKLRELLDKSLYKNPAVRLFRAGIGWGGPKLGMALDESKDTKDTLLNIDNIKILIDENVKNLIGSAPLEIYFYNTAVENGFMIKVGAGCHG